MSRFPRSSNVRRRLFPDDDVTTQAKVENSTNYLHETIERDIKEKIQKWNFDFENDVPLAGDYEWIPCSAEGLGEWIGRKRRFDEKHDVLEEKHDSLEEKDDLLEEKHDTLLEKHDNLEINKKSDVEIEIKDLLLTKDEEMDKEPILSIKDLNEITPRNYRVEEMPIRKRKSEIIDAKDLDKGVRRKISFD